MATPDCRPVYTTEQFTYLQSQNLILEFDSDFLLVKNWVMRAPCMRAFIWPGDPTTPDGYSRIPRDREGVATLSWMGFKSNACEDIWDTYRAVFPMLKPHAANMLQHTLDALESLHNEYRRRGGRDWQRFLKMVGFTDYAREDSLQTMRKDRCVLVGDEWKWLKWQMRQRYWVLETAQRYADMHRHEKECAKWLKQGNIQLKRYVPGDETVSSKAYARVRKGRTRQ